MGKSRKQGYNNGLKKRGGKYDGHLEENTNFDANNHQLDGMVHEQTN